ncbi:MAG: hypothetical protein OEZ01_12805, partial [Candidatus Heimdallarchaeota archaeon]|nr:hypothetical protein [Candidatus Heimdallarchaeota archaeon]
MSGNIPTSITPMAAGDSFDTAIEISIGTPFNSQLNDSNFYYQFVKFQGSAATVVDIILNLEGSDVGQDMDFDLYDEYQSYLDGSYDVAYPETISDYQLPYTGFYYIYIYQYNPEAGDSNFSISVNQKSQGIVEGEIVWENLFSKSHGDAEDMMKYLQAEGFIANDFSSFDLYSLESNSPKDYVKSASLIIYGLLRYAESAISRNPVDPASEIFLILDLCVNIFEYVDIISLPNGLLPVDLSFIPATDPDFPALGEELVLLQDNVYNLMVMNDLRWSVIRAADKYGYVVNEFDDPYQYANDLVQRANNTYNALRSTFYVNDSAPGFFSKTFVNDVTFLNQGKTNSSTVELESNALLLQVISKMRLSGINYSYALPGALLPAELDAYNVTLATHQEALYNFIVANLTVSSVPFTTIRAPGIGVESWDLVTGVKSDWSTLLGQIFLIETYRWDSYFYDTYYLNSGYLGTGISGEIIPADVDRAADLAYNTIILFYRNGLPVDRILNNETYQGDTSSIYSISQLLGVFRRLSNTYQDLFRLYGSDPVYGREWVEVGKVWLRAARDLRATVDEKLFDNTKKSYIPQYDHRANLSYRKDTVYESNSFLANAIMLEEHTLRFPFRGYLSYDDEVSVGTPSFLYLNFDDLDYDLPLIFHSKSFYLDISLKVTLTDSTGFTKEIANIPGFLIGESAYGNVLDIVYTVQNKGIYSMTFEVTLENEVVVFKTVEAKALGLIHFDTTSDTRDIVYTHQITNTYTTEFLLRDESNNQIADLNLKAFWSSTGDDSGIIDNSKYLKRGVRSSSSGKVSMSFDISTIIQDFNKNTELINNGEISFWILLNASSPESQFLEMIDPYIALPVSIVLSSLEVIVSPDIISFDQGTEDDLSISFNVKNNLGAVVGAANIGIFSGQQSLGSSTTASNGLTQITIDADDLAIFNPGFNEITIKVNHTRYPDLEFNYQVNVVPNSLRLELDSEPNFEV